MNKNEIKSLSQQARELKQSVKILRTINKMSLIAPKNDEEWDLEDYQKDHVEGEILEQQKQDYDENQL